MNIERERRWLIDLAKIPAEALDAPNNHLTQGYLTAPRVTPILRIRILRDHAEAEPRRAIQTAKLPGADGVGEIEFDVPLQGGADLMSISLARLEKVRYELPHHDDLVIELDLFKGAVLEGQLALAEVELRQFSQPLTVPSWFGPEITGRCPELSNVNIAFNPEAAVLTAKAILAAEGV